MSKINKKRTCLYFIHYCALVVLFFSFPILASVLGVGKILHFLQFRFSYLKKTKKLHCFCVRCPASMNPVRDSKAPYLS